MCLCLEKQSYVFREGNKPPAPPQLMMLPQPKPNNINNDTIGNYSCSFLVYSLQPYTICKHSGISWLWCGITRPIHARSGNMHNSFHKLHSNINPNLFSSQVSQLAWLSLVLNEFVHSFIRWVVYNTINMHTQVIAHCLNHDTTTTITPRQWTSQITADFTKKYDWNVLCTRHVVMQPHNGLRNCHITTEKFWTHRRW